MIATGDRNVGDDNNVCRARLNWQCRRGMLELELALQCFMVHDYDQACVNEQRAFETLLNYPDHLLLDYVMGRVMPVDPVLAHVVARIRKATAA